ncbi:MAG: hypothetical protein RLY97_297 [Pseudomonadota bacterium]
MAFWGTLGASLGKYASGWRKYALALPLGIAASLGLAGAVLDSAIGHRWLADMIASISASNGLHVKIGRIDGSIYGQSSLQDLRFSDPKGVFLTVPEAELDWHPLRWILPNGGLNVHELALRRGKLWRWPQLRSGDPQAPLLPAYDLKIASLKWERLTISNAILGQERKIDLAAAADLHQGRALIQLNGALGGGDRLNGRLDADEAHNRFDLALDYAAPKGGVLAGLTGAAIDRRVTIAGKGDWQNWHGELLAVQGGQNVAKARLDNHTGKLDVVGELYRAAVNSGTAQRMIGDVLAIQAHGQISDGSFQGQVDARSNSLVAVAKGAVDLRAGRFEQVNLAAQMLDAGALGEGVRAEDLRGTAVVDGALFAPQVQYAVSAKSFAGGRVILAGVGATGTAAKGTGAGVNNGWQLPLTLTAQRVTTGQAALDSLLIQGRGQGVFRLANGRLQGDKVTLAFPNLNATLAIDGDLARGDWSIKGPVHGRNISVAGIGRADLAMQMAASRAAAVGWKISGKIQGRMQQWQQAVLGDVIGDVAQFSGLVAVGFGHGMTISQAQITGSKITASATGQIGENGQGAFAGSGSQADYGAFRFETLLAAAGVSGHVVLDEPIPSLALRDLRLDFSPRKDGLDLRGQGQSALGQFSGVMALIYPQNAPTRLDITRIAVSQTQISGSLIFQQSGLSGNLLVAGGGVDGTIGLAGRGQVSGKDLGQAVNVALALRDARFGEGQPLVIGEGRIDARGLLAQGHSTVIGSFYGAGIGKGRLFVGRAAGKANLRDGIGQMTASIAGRRGSNFDLQIQGDVAPQRIRIIAQGNYAGQAIATLRPVLLSSQQGNWTLAPSEAMYGGGRVTAAGQFGHDGTQLDLGLMAMPLALSDVVFANLGLGGKASGKLHYSHLRGSLPQGDAQILIHGLTRSGLVLTSRPVDVAVVARLNRDDFETRAVASENGQLRGRLQARISGLPAGLPGGGDVGARLRAGVLAGGLRYDGPADAPFRLIALDHFDLTGPLALAADVSGSLDNPQIRGSLAGDGLRLQSALIGVDISQISTRGAFSGSKLTLSRLTGQTAGGGRVEGSGAFDFSGMNDNRGPGIDLKLGAKAAQILARSDLALTASGPLRILSDGRSGTIAGRLAIDSARWRLGQSAAAAELPQIATKEIGRSADVAPAGERRMPWRFLVDAAGPGRIRVQGLGIDSEWGADLHLRGSLDAPTLLGQADLVRGSYDFAGKSFELRRGRLRFDGGSPPDPRLDIVAVSELSGLNASILVRGTSLRPEIGFSSVPVLPEEELVSRLLFGSSITQISAPEALQLGAALASLRGGGGLDPINTLRRAIGLDRLRIIGADVTQGRQTGIAVGKYLGRRVYAEIVTDGRGYSATNLEFRVTSWLSLLGSVSTVGRQNVNARVSKDY